MGVFQRMTVKPGKIKPIFQRKISHDKLPATLKETSPFCAATPLLVLSLVFGMFGILD